ncbi:MAG: hypothetical protein H7Y31_01945 [Chitinophagaceae bacterium]|nr:hypothetical protein [Chitinophagaceae bacterium]
MHLAFITRNFSLRLSLIFFILICIVGCQKEVSFQKPNAGGSTGGSAAFALVPVGAACSDATLVGIYEAGKALTSNAVLTITVNVTKIGTWTYSTGLVNGFVFAGAGTFTDIGNQSITLSGGGTPVAAGNSEFALSIGGATCTVAVPVMPANTGGGSTGDYYYKATIGGVNYSQTVTDDNDYEAGSGMGGMNEVVFGAGINYMNRPLPAGFTEIGVSKGKMLDYSNATPATFTAYFSPGNYPYAPPSYNDGNGIQIFWTDPTGKEWSTINGTANQTGSTFKIISVADSFDALGRVYRDVKMEFTCKLYDEAGAVKQLTNGEMFVVFGML